MCSHVDRKRKLWRNDRKLLLLSNFELLYIIDIEKNKIDMIWSYRMIKKCKIRASKKELTIELISGQLSSFKLIDGSNTRQWKQRLTNSFFKVH